MQTKPKKIEMKIEKEHFSNRKGSVLIMALILLAVMSVIGATASMSTRTEIIISYNTQVSRQAFYAADSGIEISPKIITKIIDLGTIPAAEFPGVTIDPGLVNEIMGYTLEDDPLATWENSPDLAYTLDVTSLMVDIDRDPGGPQLMPGGGVQFASGAEGVGGGSSGGVMLYYRFDASGSAPSNSRSNLDAYYRKVVGVAGGT